MGKKKHTDTSPTTPKEPSIFWAARDGRPNLFEAARSEIAWNVIDGQPTPPASDLVAAIMADLPDAELAELLLEASERDKLDDFTFDSGSTISGLMVAAAVRLKRLAGLTTGTPGGTIRR